MGHKDFLHYLAPHRLTTIAFIWAIVGFFLMGGVGDSLRSFGVSPDLQLVIAFLPPLALWGTAKVTDRYLPMTPQEARTLISAYAALLAPEPSHRFPEDALPCSRSRLKRAFAIVVPMAVAEHEAEYLAALRSSYSLLANFGTRAEHYMAKSLQLNVEFDRLAGQSSTISQGADAVRAAARALGATEQDMRRIAAAELRAKRESQDDARLDHPPAPAMTPGAQRNAILGLASSLPTDRQRAAADVMKRARGDELSALSLHRRFTAVLAADWRLLPQPHEPIIKALSSAMGNPTTDLLVVNILAYALAAAGEDGLTELLPLLSHEVFWVRAYAAEGLGSLDNKGRWAVPALCRALESCQLDWTAYTMIRALGNIGGTQATAVLESMAAKHRGDSPPDPYLLEALEGALAAARAQE